jgi:ribosomal protein S18 acetylase RimI-like enzyme
MLPGLPKNTDATEKPMSLSATNIDLTLRRVLARAFEHDPIAAYVLPDERTRLARLERVYRIYLNVFARLGMVVTTDELDAAALWLPPDRYPLTALQNLRLLPAILITFGRQSVRALNVMSALEGAAPPRGHYWYLGVLGVTPPHQGQGIGTKLLKRELAICDAAGAGAYLEVASEANLAFYERHGFSIRSELSLRDGPRVWTMWRDPQQPGSD